jgi:DNA replication protein DnaC
VETKKEIRCRVCGDEEGALVRGEDGVERWRPCKVCQDWRKAERIMKQSRITEEFRKKTFRSFKRAGCTPSVCDAMDAAEAYTEEFARIREERGNSIALLGVPGCGKTHLLMAVSNALVSKGVPLIYFPWVEGFNELKDNLSELEARIGLLQRIDVLYIDDMWKGREKPTPFQIEQAFAIVNYRYMNKLPMLISSEYDIDGMCEFDMAIGSRIYEMCKDYCVVIKGNPKQVNYRLRA